MLDRATIEGVVRSFFDLVHGYQDVDLEVVRNILVNRLDDLLAFVRTIRARRTS